MSAINFVKVFSYKARVFVDGQPTGETQVRTKALFYREISLFDGKATRKQYATLLMNAGVTAEECEDYFATDVDYSDVITFKATQDSEFYVVVPK